MNASTPFSDDELSAALDGELDPEALVRLEADPEASARLASLRAAADAVGSPVPPLEDDTVDRMITAALDEPAAPPRPAAAPGRGRWLVAAAVILLMAAGLTLVWAGRDDGSGESAAADRTDQAEPEAADAPPTTVATAEELAADGSTAFSTGSGEAGLAPTAGAAGGPVDLGAFDSSAALRSAVATAWSASTTTADANSTKAESRSMAPPDELQIQRCGDQAAVIFAVTTDPTRVGYATVGDAPTLVYEFTGVEVEDGQPASNLVIATDVDTCTPLLSFVR